MSSSIASLVARIDERLAQLSEEIETLSRSRAALERDSADAAGTIVRGRLADGPSARWRSHE